MYGGHGDRLEVTSSTWTVMMTATDAIHGFMLMLWLPFRFTKPVITMFSFCGDIFLNKW